MRRGKTKKEVCPETDPHIHNKDKRKAEASGAHSVEFLGELRFPVVGVVLVDNAFGSGGVDGGNGFGIELRRFFLVARFDGGQKFLDLRLQRGFDGFVLQRLLFGNQNSLFRGFNIRHDDLLILSCFS